MFRASPSHPCPRARRTSLVAGVALAIVGTGPVLDPDARDAALVAAYGGASAPRAARFFVANRGQRPAGAPYAISGQRAELAFGPDGVVWTAAADAPTRAGASAAAGGPARARAVTARLRFVGARPGAHPEGRGRLPTTVSYFKGPRERWRVGVPTYRRVVYADLWPGIDLEFSPTAAGVAHTFRVRPGADPARIRLAWDGGAPDGIDGTVWRLDGTTRTAEAGRAAVRPAPARTAGRAPIDADGASGLAAVAPAYAGFFGQAGFDRALGIAVDAAGHAYIAGETTDVATGDTDAYVARVALDGSGYDYVAVIGGDGYDAGFDIDVDAAGRAVVAGITMSGEGDGFPATLGPDLTFNGVADALVARVTADGKDLAFAGYLGGELTDFAEGVRVDAHGDVYVHGIALSSHATFPVKTGPDLTFNGETDAFVAKVKAVPDAGVVADNLVYSGFIGGAGSDVIALQDGTFAVLSSGQIGLDAAGALYVSGATTSDEASFPTGEGFAGVAGADKTYAGGWDAYVAKVRPDGAGLAYATYVGGAGQDFGKGMAVDGAGRAHLTGYTRSDEATLPVTVGPDLTYNGGSDDALIARLRPDGSAFDYLGYLGGAGTDVGEAVAVDAAGRLHVVGYSDSTADTFPVKAGPDLTQNDAEPGIGDAFVARLKAEPSAAEPVDNVDFAGYIGGGAWEQAYWVAVDGRGDVYVVGDTESDAATFPDGDGLGDLPGPSRTAGGGGDGFVMKVRPDGAAPTPPGSATTAPTPTKGPTPPGPRPATFLPAAFNAGGPSPAGAADRDRGTASGRRDRIGMRSAFARPGGSHDRNGRRAAGLSAAAALAGGGTTRFAAGPPRADAPRQIGDLTLIERSFDDFCDFGIGWAWEKTDEHDLRLDIADDGTCTYRMTQLADGAFVSVSDGHAATGDFVVAADVTPQGRDGVVGIAFGVPVDFSRALFYVVAQDGDYGLFRFADGGLTSIGGGKATVDGTRPLALAAAVRDASVTLYLNGTALAEIPDTSPHAGRVGTYVEWAGGTGAFTAEYARIRVSAISAP